MQSLPSQWTFDTVTQIDLNGCGGWYVTLSGFAYDFDHRPVIGWTARAGCGGMLTPWWGRFENNGWVFRQINKAGHEFGTGPFSLALNASGTPFYAYVGETYWWYYYAYLADLGAYPNGNPFGDAGPYPISFGQYPCPYQLFALDTPPLGTIPNVLVSDPQCTPSGGTGLLYLNGRLIQGGRQIPGAGWFSSIDYAAGPAADQHHAVYFASRSGGRQNGAMYSNGTPDHEVFLTPPPYWVHSQVSVVADSSNRTHIAIGNVPHCADRGTGSLLYATSPDGSAFEKTFVDLDSDSGKSPSIALSGEGRPYIAYWRTEHSQLRLAWLADNGQWSSVPVFTPSPSTRPNSTTQLTFNPAGEPAILFFNEDGRDQGTPALNVGHIQIASGGPANLPPVVTNPGSQASAPGAVVSLPIIASDPEGDALTYKMTFKTTLMGDGSASCPVTGLVIDPATGIISGTIVAGAEAGSPYSVAVSVTDARGNSGTVTFPWAVNTNRAPTMTSPSDQTSAEGTSVSLPITASDPDGDALTYIATGLPPGLTIDAGTGIISGALGYAAAGTYTVMVTVSDGTLTASASFAWTVTDVNRAPTMTSPGDQTSAEGTSVSLAIVASDPDGDALIYNATGLPPGLSIDGTTGVISGALGYAAAGTYSVIVTVSDGTAQATARFTWTVTDVNRAPTVTSPGDQTSAEGTSVSLPIAASDPDGDALTYSATGLPSGVSISSATGLISGALGYTTAGNYAVTVTVSDGTLTASASFAWTVTNVNRAPTVTSPGDQTSAEGTSVSLPIAASDPDGDALTYSATGLPSGVSISSTTGLISGALDYTAAGTYAVTVTVTDGKGGLASASFLWRVDDVPTGSNRAPVCTAAVPSVSTIWPPNHKQTIPVQILGVTDPDGDPVTIMIRRILQDEPTNTLGDGTTWIDGGGIETPRAWVRAERSGTPKVPGNGRVYEISFEAFDGRGLTCSGTVFVGVPHDLGKGQVVDDGIRYDSTVAGGPRVR